MAKRYDNDFMEAIQWLLNHKFKLMQNLNEIYWLYSLMKQMDPKPKVFVEIGSLEGGSMFILSTAMPKGSMIISIDPKKTEERDLTVKFVRKQGKRVVQIIGKSEDADALRRVEMLMNENGGNLDVLFIDGSHEYEAAKFDFDIYGALVEKGLIAMHDISPGCKNNIRVHELWDEIKQKEPSWRENVNRQKVRGIGVVTR